MSIEKLDTLKKVNVNPLETATLDLDGMDKSRRPSIHSTPSLNLESGSVDSEVWTTLKVISTEQEHIVFARSRRG